MIMDRDRRRRRSAGEHNRDTRPGDHEYPQPAGGVQNRGHDDDRRKRGDDRGRADG